MKKTMLTAGLAYILAGIVFLLCGIFLDTTLNGLFWGLAGGGIAPGLAMVYRYVYWTRPQNSAKYAEKMEEETINLRDERKEKLRNQSGRYAYILGLVTVSISILVVSVLSSLELIENANLLLFYLAGYVIFQYIAGILIFRRLERKY
ncbi:hypothetical protein [Oscillibacter sp.]|uniref:hypothetical protein n=1 Tax=Oscillibacter sp. TaxID=1945593 RepID=UPI0028994D56|nr:hypothetical protein [Oscillibacter sp.]